MSIKNDNSNRNLGDEAPRLKDYVIVFVAVLVIIAISWLSYKLGWLN